jgi:hypothetical protein
MGYLNVVVVWWKGVTEEVIRSTKKGVAAEVRKALSKGMTTKQARSALDNPICRNGYRRCRAPFLQCNMMYDIMTGLPEGCGAETFNIKPTASAVTTTSANLSPSRRLCIRHKIEASLTTCHGCCIFSIGFGVAKTVCCSAMPVIEGLPTCCRCGDHG